MKSIMAMAWKEWHEVRVFFFIGLGIFLGLPVIGELERIWGTNLKFELTTSTWVLGFAGVFAVLTAVGATCRDFQGHLEDFWRSRPVGILRWLLVKYVVGLAVVLAPCMIALGAELMFSRDKSALIYLMWYPYQWAAIYSIGFLSGCLIRRPANAGMIALAGMLLIYFLPLVLPQLDWLSAANVGEMNKYRPPSDWTVTLEPELLKFAGGMVIVSAAALFIALIAARRNWWIESGQKMMYGSISGALLILMATVAFQHGSNLPLLGVAQLPRLSDNEFESIMSLQDDGLKVFIVVSRGSAADGFQHIDYFSRDVTVTNSGIQISNDADQYPFSPGIYMGLAWPEHHPAVAYRIIQYNDGIDGYVLNVTTREEGFAEPESRRPLIRLFDKRAVAVEPSTLPAKPSLFLWKPTMSIPIHMYAWKDRLYVFGQETVTIDISQPAEPRIISTLAQTTSWDTDLPARGVNQFRVPLPTLEGLTPRQRLTAMMANPGWYWSVDFAYKTMMEGDYVCAETSEGILAYHLSELTDNSAKFEMIGQYKPTFLDQMFGLNGYNRIAMSNGLLYLSSDEAWEDMNPGMTVFDLRGPHPLREIGHFANPGAYVGGILPLPDGRAIIGGNALYLVGPPPRRDP